MSTKYCKKCQIASTWSEFEEGTCDPCWELEKEKEKTWCDYVNANR
jgi:hypothetical protein